MSLANSKGLAAGWTDVITPNLVSTLHYGFTRAGNADRRRARPATTSGSAGSAPPMAPARALTRIIPVHLIGEDLSWNHGAHNIRFGGSFRNISNQSASYGQLLQLRQFESFLDQRFGKRPAHRGSSVSSSFKQNYEYAMAAVLGLGSAGHRGL